MKVGESEVPSETHLIWRHATVGICLPKYNIDVRGRWAASLVYTKSRSKGSCSTTTATGHNQRLSLELSITRLVL